MKNIINSIPGYRINEYLLVLTPPEELRNRINQVKKHFFDTYVTEDTIYGKPFVPLVKFVQYQMMEERLISRLNTLAMGYHPTKIELKDFGSLPSHTVYINITSKVAIQSLVKRLRSEGQQLMKLNKESRAYFIMEPNIPIAQKLQHMHYEKGWNEYRNKHFTGRFIADAMLLLKRPAGNTKYEIAQRFEFQNLPVTTTQGTLFTPGP